MSLQTALRAYVIAATGDDSIQSTTRADEMLASGYFYLSNEAPPILCVKANSVSASNIRTSGTLPTRVSTAAATVLTGLRELFDRGVITSSGLRLHEQDAGVQMGSF